MSGGIGDTAVIVIVIAAAGLAVLMGYAVHAAFNRGTVSPYDSAMQRNDDQDRYMRELRERHYAAIQQDAHWPRRPKPTYKNVVVEVNNREVSSPEY
jgi:hypothetical protein